MTAPSPAPNPMNAASALKRLSLMYELALEAFAAGDERELHFIVLNRTVRAERYDRAFLWDMDGGPRLLGVSGSSTPNAAAPGARAWRDVLRRRKGLERETLLAPPEGVLADPSMASAVWLPVPVPKRRGYGLVLERHSAPAWAEEDLSRLRPLMAAYGGAYRIFARRRFAGRMWRLCAKWILGLAVAAAVAYCLLFVTAPLRIVAPCEVTAARPTPVTAPLDGIIENVLVRPGDSVERGQTLFAYDGAVAREELDIAQKQVALAGASLKRASALALSGQGSRSDVELLGNRLAQEEVRLSMAESRVGKLLVSAPVSGMVVMGDPAEFSGRPVGTGEAVLTLVDPEKTRLRIWLPQDDRIEFDESRPPRIFLHADSGAARRAELVYVAPHAGPGDDGIYGFMAEADWRDGAGEGARLGLKGTAVLYGADAPLWYWLLRKPLAAVRRFLGV